MTRQALLVLGLLGAFGHGANAQVTVPLLVPGQEVPGTNPGVVVVSSGVPVINEPGDVLLGAVVSGPGIASSVNDRVLLFKRATETSFSIIAQTGATFNGLNGDAVLQSTMGFGLAFVRYSLDDTGAIGFLSGLAGQDVTTSTDVALWHGTPGSFRLVAREGSTLPGLPVGVVAQTLTGVGGNAGRVFALASLAGTGVGTSNDAYFLLSTQDEPSEFAYREGVELPGLAGYLGTLGGAAMARDASIFVLAQRTGPGVTTANDDVMLRTTGSNAQTYLLEGDPAPTLESDVLVSTFNSVTFSNETTLARVTLSGNVAATHDEMFLVGRPGAWRRVYRESDPVPGEPGLVMGALTANVARTVNAAGDAVFLASILPASSSTDTGLFAYRGGALELLLREGDQVPGLPAGVAFSGATSGVCITENGTIVLLATLTGPGVDATNNSCYLYAPAGGTIRRLVREGDPADVGGNSLTLGTLVPISTTGATGLPAQINQSGVMVWTSAGVAGGTASFITDLLAPVTYPAWRIPPALEANTNTGVFGTEFTIDREVEVTALGYYDDTFSSPLGLDAPHPVGIYDASTEQLIMSGIVPAGSSTRIADSFRFVDISPVRLEAGRTYVLASVSTGDPGHNVARADMTPGLGLTIGAWRSGLAGPSLSFPSTLIATSARFMGGTFEYVEADTPTCVADVDDGGGTGAPDGAVTIDDLLYYVALFQTGDAAADVDDGSGTGAPDDAVTIDDLLYFLTRFAQGC